MVATTFGQSHGVTRLRSPGSANVVPDRLVYQIHAEFGCDANWSESLETLRSWLDAHLVFLGFHCFSSAKGEILYCAPNDLELREPYAAYAARNPWFLSSADYVTGRVMTGAELISEKELVRTDFYRRVLQPRRLLDHICGVIATRGDVVYYITAFRNEVQDVFADGELGKLRHVLPHFSLALENQRRYLQTDDLAKTLMRVVDQHTHAILLTTSAGRVVYMNKRAEAIRDNRGGLFIDNNHIRATNGTDNRTLRDAIAAVAKNTTSDVADVSRVVSISETGRSTSTVVTVRASGQLSSTDADQSDSLVILTLANSHTDHDPHTCVFARQFALTPAQARVSALVFSGHSLLHTARELHISENTVRSHLKQVFEKTNTHGQMELVHLHARLCVSEGY